MHSTQQLIQQIHSGIAAKAAVVQCLVCLMFSTVGMK